MTSIGEAGLAYLRNTVGSTSLESQRTDRAERHREQSNGLSIELDSPYVFFYGRVDQTESQKLRGRVKVNLASQMRIRSLTVDLEGFQKTTHWIKVEEIQKGLNFTNPCVTHKSIISAHKEIVDEEGSLVTRIPAGEQSYPFEIELPGTLPETVEGLPGNKRFFILRAKASAGPLTRDLKAKRQVRVIRTLTHDLSEEINPVDVSGVWPDKIQYSIGTASRAVVYGDKLNVDFELTPLVDKLRVGKITFKLVEVEKTKTEPGPHSKPELELGDYWRVERTICTESSEVPEDATQLNPVTLDEMKKFSLSFDLPKSLKNCRQTIDLGEWIQFKHHAHYSILLHNADGHCSELKVHHPIRLFISPSMPINDDAEVQAPTFSTSMLNPMQLATEAPPVYGSHVTDAPVNPFAGIQTAINTPGLQSGAATPGRPLQQRQSSADNISGIIHGAELQARLAALAVQQRHPSEDDGVAATGTHTPPRAQGLEYDMEMLTRIVSYGAATAAPPTVVPLTVANFPPSYADATGQSPAPVNGDSIPTQPTRSEAQAN